MELEEAKKRCKNIVTTKFNNDYSIDSIDKEAIETVLEELDNRIPKKKIEDKIKELEEKYNNSVNDVYKKPTEALIDFQRIVGAKEVLQQLLEEK